MISTTIGGDRLGTGNKQKVSMKTYDRSTHDLSYTWRSSMSSGTLVPFQKLLCLPGDTVNMTWSADVLSLPTVGPLFGSYKVQLDCFLVPIRLFNRQLHMNKLNIGRNINEVLFPTLELKANAVTTDDYEWINTPNGQTNPSSLLRYLGINGIGRVVTTGQVTRKFNALGVLSYWQIYKQYYANKQQDNGVFVMSGGDTNDPIIPLSVNMRFNLTDGNEDILDTSQTPGSNGIDSFARLNVSFDGSQISDVDAQIYVDNFTIRVGSNDVPIGQLFNVKGKSGAGQTISYTEPTTQMLGYSNATTFIWNSDGSNGNFLPSASQGINLAEFPLENIDEMREYIFEHPDSSAVEIDNGFNKQPYNYHDTNTVTTGIYRPAVLDSQTGLGIKTYQSDLFNNWINTDWIDGVGGINEISSVDTTGDSFTIDSLNLAKKVYVMLNRIAISGGSYDDWLKATYTHDRVRGVEEPVYMGSLIKELAFQEVVSTALASEPDASQPLGTLGGRGQLTQKNKGGKLKVRVDEPSILISLVSLTPRVDYSQGNDWDTNLLNMDDLHKPELSAIGYEDLISDQMTFLDSTVQSGQPVLFKTVGKVPAWINYMTAVNKCYGDFADENKTMFMTLNRRYETDENGVTDITTYIDPAKYNYAFADTNLDAQNFWVQIRNECIVRRKMSAKLIPNL